MTIMVYINQEPAGTLTVSRDGLYTVLEAEAAGRDGLVRLWAHGSGKSAYLGLMQPWDDGLRLRRRLSRRELAAFPDPIEFISDRERDGEEEQSEQDTKDLHNEVNINNDPEKDAQAEAAEDENAESEQNTETDYASCPWPAPLPEDGLLWYSRSDGTLTAFDGISSLLALPAELRTPGAGTVERVIEGKKYLVFRY